MKNTTFKTVSKDVLVILKVEEERIHVLYCGTAEGMYESQGNVGNETVYVKENEL
jgi:hypothetical protein